jgi:predicted DNA-binding antitoxin AbrB/MazE fold protein
MIATVHAFFENGLFRPVEPIGLPERSLVEIEVHSCEEPSTALLATEKRLDSDVGDTAARHDETETDS